MTCDPDELDRFWLNAYCPEVIAVEAVRYPAIRDIAEGLGGSTDVLPVPIPLDCTDGFNEAYYGRPEMMLDPAARLACSAWSFVADDLVRRSRSGLAMISCRAAGTRGTDTIGSARPSSVRSS
jgi:hypothetical protein